MKKTLVIHPRDPSTAFLAAIYLDKDWTVMDEDLLNCGYRTSQISDAIASHDRIVMLGHGCPQGLYNAFYDLVIDYTLAGLLQGKDNVCIWCMSDLFVEKYSLSGFYTGMIISEASEAIHFKVPHSPRTIDQSNRMLAQAVGRYINHPDMLFQVKAAYRPWRLLMGNKIIEYNRQNLYKK